MSPQVLLAATGALRRVYEEVDWAATPVGPIEGWGPALRNAADFALHTHFPITLLWGPEFTLIYNEAYAELIADKHPAALGRPAEEVFPEAWDQIGPWMRATLAGEGTTYIEDAAVPLVRHGRLQEAYFTFSYSPVRAADGVIEGVIDIATETTGTVIDRRRLQVLNRLRALLADVDQPDGVAEEALAVLRTDPDDFPEVALEPQPPGPPEVRVEDGVARLPLGRNDDQVLAVRLSDRLAPDDVYLDFLRLVATSIGQTGDRVRAREVERGMSEALQRTLLTPPLQPDHLQVAVRYLPAAAEAQVGGDWYDAFMSPDGALTVAVGDVAGHDRQAAAAMAQVRNLLRGVCYTRRSSPARILGGLDEAMHGLAVRGYATAVLGRIEQTEADQASGLRHLRWSNAGHPPPVLLEPDGSARLLATPPETLLGLGLPDGRSDHTVELRPGSTVVFYTDGLVERRRTPLETRFAWLTGLLEGRQDLDAEALCDHLLHHLDDAVEDDIAMLVVRAYPEDEPRPPEAGAVVMPQDLRLGG